MGLKKTYHHLAPEKRVAIMTMVQNGFSGAAIATYCDVSQSTISRELKRLCPDGVPLKERRSRYSYQEAQRQYLTRRQ